MKCKHNQRCRYTYGFYCEDCDTFFSKDSTTYRKDELMSNLWGALHNINAERGQNKIAHLKEVHEMKEKIGIGVMHENYEGLIEESLTILKKHGKDENSATLTL